MLMVIFGAGASYDSWSAYPPHALPLTEHALRLPLANQLFLPIPPFLTISQKFPPCQPLLPYLETHSNIEQELEKFREEADNDPDRGRQLLALQYYIRDVIRECEWRWGARTCGVSNYKTLLDQIRKHPEVCFVTFNYDTLLETALAGIGVQIPNIAAYVSEPNYKLFKLHGSTNWERRVPAKKTTIPNDSQPSDQALLYSSPVVDESSFVRKLGDSTAEAQSRELYHSFPALAIPTASKSTFVCPPEHVRVLAECIPKVSRILIVGWRAGEQHFLEMVAAGLSKPVRVMAACEKLDASTETLDRLKPIVPTGSTFLAARGGFTDFVKQRESEWLLS